ncbi:MAG: zf-HC2 domain-containing protein [Chloroflexota bacterium]
MTDHLGADLSAYLDGALAPAERAGVQSHLDACSPCRARLEELRATASLLAALPSPRPSRGLAPRFVERLNWLRPLRSLSLVASGAFLFLFMATAILETGSDLGGGPPAPFGGTRGAGPAAAPAPATRTASADRTETAQKATAPTAPLASPLPSAIPAAPAFRFGTQATATPFNIGTASPEAFGLDAERDVVRLVYGQPRAVPLPFVWLALAIVAAVLAFVAHRRLRAT